MQLTRVTLLTLAVAVTTSVAICPTSDWQELFGMCYRQSPGPVLWTSVASFCQAIFPGSRAVVQVDYTINSFLSDRVMAGEEAWMGLCCEGECYDKEGFEWLDGTPLDWELWERRAAFHGNGSRCAYLNSVPDGEWNAYVDDTTSYPVLCQIAAV